MSTAQAFCDWLNEYNGSAFTATQGIVNLLSRSNFEKDGFLKDRGYHTRNGSSVVAWRRGTKFDSTKPGTIVILASHTDSPCLRTRPHDKISSEQCHLLGVSTYGGGLWHTWFDRPLGLSGCVTGHSDGKIITMPVRIDQPIAVVPNLCIHLQNREDAQAFKPQPEDNLRPVLDVTISADDGKAPQLALASHILAETNSKLQDILSYDLCLYDIAPASIIGLKRDMISAPGLDNKSSLWTTFKALTELTSVELDDRMVVCIGFDHEEIGSESNVGAGGDLLLSVMARLMKGAEIPWAKCLVLSCDAAHAVHPNYASKHQSEHKPYLNRGTVVKINVNQRYATSSDSLGVLRSLAKQKNGLEIQEFVVRNDSPCGSTIGPMTAAKTGCATIDVGMPIWAMHSCREICGVEDLDQLILLAKTMATNYESPPFNEL